ncbi:helix-turn-helix domain-containing protein [Xanthomonas campestris pv. zingibericola]|uniref:helix-turn-helix domain-containing protein n=1 Tax=Xanthomonas euvesicatoria TaxID=456327 RepID=UPI0016B78539|nr:helix-turn-helix domain-containing protein [Xanthomonas euvesicatoria]MBV6857934.1 helix-turn-helix domain-containing protein [Xanthomonas campestris pv. zingibericola]
MSMLEDRLSYTLDQASEVTGLGRTAFYRQIAANQIRTFKVGRRRMVSAQALRDFIEKKEREAAASGVAA